MSATNGWIKLHRKVWDNPRSSDPCWLAVWIYLLCHANHNGKKAVWNGQIITLKPGQLITGRKSISRLTGVNEAKVYRALTVLKSEQQIEQQTSNVSSLITILNWTQYQESEQQSEQPTNSQRTTNEQPANTPKECKNVRMEERVDKDTQDSPSGRVAKKFQKPTLPEWLTYAADYEPLWTKEDAQSAYDHYESNGWKVGRNPMSDWKASLRTCCNRWRKSDEGRLAKDKASRKGQIDYSQYDHDDKW